MPERHDMPFEISQWNLTINGMDVLIDMKGVLTADLTSEPDTFHTPGVEYWDIVAVPSIESMTAWDEDGVEYEAVVKGKDTGKLDVDKVLEAWMDVAQDSEWLDQLGRDHIL